MKRFPTDKPGVFYRTAKRIGGRGTERVYYVLFKKDGKVFEEKVGRQYADDMTPSKASLIRAARIEGRRKSRKEIREAQQAVKDRWTITKLWEDYQEKHSDLKGLTQDECRFNLYIKPNLGDKEPSELVPLDVDRIRVKLSKTKSAATVKNTLELLRRILNYAADRQLCAIPGFKIKLPTINNLRTEDLSSEQMNKLLQILRAGVITNKDESETLIEPDARDAMLLALSSGMRRMEIFRLEWKDVDFRRGFITIRNPKGGTDQTIPMSDAARQVLESRSENKSPFVFPSKRKRESGKKQTHRTDASKQFRMIRDAAGLPKDFRPMHGLRHAFASHLASSGEVDLYTIQRLLTHKSPAMTMRYAHLRDEALRRASNLVGELIQGKEG